MPDLLLYGDTEHNASLRHELPIAIGDPLLFAEIDGRAQILTSHLERERIAAVCPDAVMIDFNDVGYQELLHEDMTWDELMLEMVSRAVQRIGIREATVDFGFALAVAERLRADGVHLSVDNSLFNARRRVKNEQELAGVRRAQHAAEAGMAAAAAVIRSAEAVDARLYIDGEPLLAEYVRAALREACAAHGALAPPDVIVASVWQGFGHEPGSGPLPAGLPIVVDLWPRDERSACWADMTRTFVAGGEPSEETRRQERLVREALESARAAIRPGITGRELHALSCEVFEREGYRTQRTGPGDDPSEGFQFSLGHGVGLRVHEDPALGMTGSQPLVAGDVLAVEPGLWDRAAGSVRFEDLVLVTDDGCETLTDYPYTLTP